MLAVVCLIVYRTMKNVFVVLYNIPLRFLMVGPSPIAFLHFLTAFISFKNAGSLYEYDYGALL